MIPQITENFGAAASYATLSNATVSLAEMGDRTIQTQVKIDGDIVPDFEGWELSFRGERFVLDVRDPQAAKDNTSRNSLIDLTFYSWPTLQLKRYFFFTAPSTATGVITVDKYNAPVTLTLANFGTYLNMVLEYYFHGKITADVYIDPNDPNTEAASWDINYTKIWDVIQKIYELYGVRWRIEYVENTESYVIKINHPAPEIDDHEFQYGFQGGLLRFERQVQNGEITNILLGRGGTQNVPYRYFKQTDPQNPEWAADPDAIPELANLYMDRIRDINFRNYVQGWKTNPNRDTTTWPGTVVEPYDAERGATDWAYAKGHTDTTLDPVEYVKDDESILKYGEHWGHLDDDDDIYPTIQGMTADGGPADLVVAVSPIVTDNIEEAAVYESNIVDLSNGILNQTNTIEENRTGTNLQYEEIWGDTFTIPAGMTANLKDNGFFIAADTQRATLARLAVVTEESSIKVYRVSDDVEVSISGIPAGEYYYVIYCAIRNSNSSPVGNATYGVNGLWLEQTTQVSEGWKPTFDIWIRNVFETTKGVSESAEDYALRVWGPVLGDRLGNEAAVAFSDGFMSISEDYDFKIASYPEFDQSKTLNGYQSEWKITLRKSDAEYDATGYYIPNATTGGKPIAGDHFYFIGIDMPHLYVVKAEEHVNENKVLALYGKSDIAPTWVVSLDKVRLDQEYNLDQERLFDKIEAGVKMVVRDKRFTNNNPIELFANSVTFTWADGTVVLPQTEVVLADKIAVTKSQIAALQGDVTNLKSSIAQMSDAANVIREEIKPLFLGKTGEQEEVSLSPTRFASLLTSKDFQQGGFGGKGWGFYRDNTMLYQDLEQPTRSRSLRSAGDANDSDVPAAPSIRSGEQSVLEVDKLIVRRDMQVNSLVVNQVSYIGGKQIISAAAIECTQVVENSTSYDCYFDQKQGSVKNLFQVGDFALGQVFDASNTQLKYYRAKVTAIGLDYIRLSKTEKDGVGVPEKGDVIVQYGNANNVARQYVIIRDVIGGGYEKMVQGLSTVSSAGTEYYYAGIYTRPNNTKTPRFYVGNSNSYIEFLADSSRLKLKGNIVQSPGGTEFPVPCYRTDGDYDASKTYYYGDLVMYQGQGWLHVGESATTGTAPAQGQVWQLYSARGESDYRLDLTNESATVNADANGNIVSGAVLPSCRATLYLGSATASGAAYRIDSYTQGGTAVSVTGVSINSSTGEMTFASNFNFSGLSVDITVEGYTSGGVSRMATMTVTKVLPGADGQPAASYWLVLSADKASVDPNTLPLASVPPTITATAMKQVGASAPETASDCTIKYKFDSGSETAYPSGGVSVDVTKNTLFFYLYKGSTLVDSESVPILYEGLNGVVGGNAIVLDLDNEVDAVQTDSTGLVSSARTVTTHATLYDGDEVATAAELVSTAASIAVGGVTPSLSISQGVVTASWSFTTSSRVSSATTVTITVSFGGNNYSAMFTIMPSLGQAIYQLKPSMSAIPFSRDASDNLTPASRDVGLSILKIDGGSTTTYSSTTDTGMTVRYSTLAMPSSAFAGSSWTSGDITVANSASNLYIAMFNAGGVLIDRETIPVVKDGSKGSQGNIGKVMRGVNLYVLGGVGGSSSIPYQGLEDPYDGTNPFYDMVYTVDSQTGTKTYYYCKVGGTAAGQIAPGESGSSAYWVAANQFDFVATHVLLADNAAIEFLSGQSVIVKRDSTNVVAGITGGTQASDVNIFAGSDLAGRTSAPFRVTGEGKVYATEANISGAVLASGNNYQRGSGASAVSYAIKSENGLWVDSGDAFLQDVICTRLSAGTTTQDGLSSITNTYGDKLARVMSSAGSGYVTLTGQDTGKFAELIVGNSDVSIQRGSTSSSESIVSSPTVKHIVVCNHGDVPQPGDSGYDAYTLYLEKSS